MKNSYSANFYQQIEDLYGNVFKAACLRIVFFTFLPYSFFSFFLPFNRPQHIVPF